MTEPGLDRAEWESEWEALGPDLADSPAEALHDLDDLIARMLAEAGYPLETADSVDDEGADPEVITSFTAAREVTWRVDAGEDVDPGDIADAVNQYRDLYHHLIYRELDLS